MALVVLLRGVNVGGSRVFRPTVLASQLRHLDAVNIGAAGTFVIRQPIGRTRLREEVARRLPFDTGILICDGREITALLSHDCFARSAPPGVVRFVSVLPSVPRAAPRLPIMRPSSGPWLLKLVAREGRFVLGMYRRHLEVIGYLGTVDTAFGMRATTRNLNTIAAIARVLGDPAPSRTPRVR